MTAAAFTLDVPLQKLIDADRKYGFSMRRAPG
jgi:hypothetical protein